MLQSKNIKRLLTAFLAISAGPAWAQPITGPMDSVAVAHYSIGNFLMCIIAGVLLAFGFQLVLTLVSMATGISMVGNIERRFRKPRQMQTSSEEGSHNSYTKVSAGMGIWAILTGSLSLFLATLLAVRISFIDNDQVGFTLGLVIWAAFFMIMMYVEYRTARTLLGGIMNTAISGLRSSGHMIQHLFGKSDQQKIEDIARHTVSNIRKELAHSMQHYHINDKIERYLDRIQQPQLNSEKIRKEFTALLKDLEVKHKLNWTEQGLEEKYFVDIVSKHPNLSKEDVKHVAGIFQKVMESMKTQGSKADKAFAAVDKLTPGSEEDTRRFRQKIEDYLRNTHIEALNPDQIKEDINQILSEPKTAKNVILNRLKQFDHSTMVMLVTSQRDDVTPEDAEKIVKKVENALEKVKEKVLHSKQQNLTQPSAEAMAISEGDADVGNDSGAGGGNGHNDRKNNSGALKTLLEQKIRSYLSSLNRPEFDYDQIKADFERIFHDPKTSIQTLRERFKQFDRESLIALLSSKSNVSRQDAERIVAKIEEARDSVLNRAENFEEEVKRRVREARHTAIREAEYVRQGAVAAAWWLVATAVISATAAGLGGMLAV